MVDLLLGAGGGGGGGYNKYVISTPAQFPPRWKGDKTKRHVFESKENWLISSINQFSVFSHLLSALIWWKWNKVRGRISHFSIELCAASEQAVDQRCIVVRSSGANNGESAPQSLAWEVATHSPHFLSTLVGIIRQLSSSSPLFSTLVELFPPKWA